MGTIFALFASSCRMICVVLVAADSAEANGAASTKAKPARMIRVFLVMVTLLVTLHIEASGGLSDPYSEPDVTLTGRP